MSTVTVVIANPRRHALAVGHLLARASLLAGAGLVTDGQHMLAQAAHIAGVGTSRSTGTGILFAREAGLNGLGDLDVHLAAQEAQIAGAGVSRSTGTGHLAASAAHVAGTNIAFGPGALPAQVAAVAGAGASRSTGTGALAASAAATLSGVGVVGASQQYGAPGIGGDFNDTGSGQTEIPGG